MPNEIGDFSFPPTGGTAVGVTSLVEQVRTGIDHYRENGNFVRYAGTGSAIAAGAAASLSSGIGVGGAFGAAAAVGVLGVIAPVLGLGLAGFAMAKQKQRDEHIYHWEKALESIEELEDGGAKERALRALTQEIDAANAKR